MGFHAAVDSLGGVWYIGRGDCLKRLLILTLALALLAGCGRAAPAPTPGQARASGPPSEPTKAPAPEPTEGPKAEDMVRAVDIIPGIFIDARYATERNFTGQVIYDSGEVYLRRGTAEKLAAVQKSLNAKGYSLCIWDGWRSVEAQWRLWEVCPDPRYVADPRNGVSNHCRGNMVDITLVTLEGGPVEMPSDFDAFGPEADRDYSDVSPEAAANARLLEEEMAAAGFAGYSAEWWHFTDGDTYEVFEGAAV